MLIRFDKKFIPRILSGKKQSAIVQREEPPMCGMPLYLYAKTSREGGRRFASALAVNVNDLAINLKLNIVVYAWSDCAAGRHYINSSSDQHSLKDFAMENGFDNWDDMKEWLENNAKVDGNWVIGHLITWGKSLHADDQGFYGQC